MEEELPIELEPPEGVDEANSAVAVLRAWIGDGALLLSLNASAFAEHVDACGRLLAEIGPHVASAAALNCSVAEHEAQAPAGRDAAARQALVRDRLAGFSLRGDPRSYHLWFELPEGWRAETFVAAAWRRGVAVMPAAPFAAGPRHAPNAVRLAPASPPMSLPPVCPPPSPRSRPAARPPPRPKASPWFY